MKVFVIDSENYSRQLMNYYLEEELHAQVYNFTHVGESLLYLRMNPELFIYDKSQSHISIEAINILLEKGIDPHFIAFDNDVVTTEKVNENREFEIVEEYPIQNTYFSVIEACEQLAEIVNNRSKKH